MAKPSATATPKLIFQGLPRRLSLSDDALAGYECGELTLPPALAPHSQEPTVQLPIRERGPGRAGLRLRLAPGAPPGRHQATLRMGEKTLPVELAIAPAPRLEIFPPSADFAGSRGTDAEVEVTLANTGNVTIDLPQRFATGIFDDLGLEAAFAETYRSDTNDPATLLGCWLRALRGGYGGLLKLRIARGAGPLPPGARRTFVLSAHIPECLKPGHSYHGIWKLGPLHHRLTVAALR